MSSAENRQIKFRAWRPIPKLMYDWEKVCNTYSMFALHKDCGIKAKYFMQYTGLKDKNGVTDIYEGDIIDSEGNIKGNIYESPQIYEEGIDCLIEGLGTKTWRDTESIAMGRGCHYAE